MIRKITLVSMIALAPVSFAFPIAPNSLNDDATIEGIEHLQMEALDEQGLVAEGATLEALLAGEQVFLPMARPYRGGRGERGGRGPGHSGGGHGGGHVGGGHNGGGHHGGGHWGDDHGPRRTTCYARNGRGVVFKASGRAPRARLQRAALRACDINSRTRCRALGCN